MARALVDDSAAVLLDLNGTFAFDCDRLSADEDFPATYKQVGGSILEDDEVQGLILALRRSRELPVREGLAGTGCPRPRRRLSRRLGRNQGLQATPLIRGAIQGHLRRLEFSSSTLLGIEINL